MLPLGVRPCVGPSSRARANAAAPAFPMPQFSRQSVSNFLRQPETAFASDNAPLLPRKQAVNDRLEQREETSVSMPPPTSAATAAAPPVFRKSPLPARSPPQSTTAGLSVSGVGDANNACVE